MDKKVIWDEDIAAIRFFQAEFVKCVRGTLSDNMFSRWLNTMNGYNINIKDIAGQYIDMLNIKYIGMMKEKRLKNLSAIAKRIAQFSEDDTHIEIKKVVMNAAREYGCQPGAIKLQGIDYPQDIEW